MNRLRALAVSCAVALSACSPGLPDPSMSGVSPAWGYNGEDTEVLIEGRDFYPRVQVSGQDSFEIDRQFRAWLDGPERLDLEAVASLDYSSLSGVVPAGLETGLYDLHLQGPSGAEAVLADAFTVTDTRADHLLVEVDQLSYQVNALARLSVQLVDPGGNAVALPLQIVAGITEDAPDVRFQETLDGQRESGLGIEGRLGPDGHGYIALTSSTPDDVWVTLGPAAEDSVVTGHTQLLSFTAGDEAEVVITLPNPDYAPQAGVPFDVEMQLVDEDGNPTEGAAALLHVWEACGDPTSRFDTQFSVFDAGTLEDVVLTGATDPDTCPENMLLAAGTGSAGFISGESSAFDVSPGPVAGFLVDRSPPEVSAGDEAVILWVEAVDAWRNPVRAHADELTVRDSAGGVDVDLGTGDQRCDVMVGGNSGCVVFPWKSGDAVRLTVTGASGLVGVADPVVVWPGAPEATTVTVLQSSVAAGELFDVNIYVSDAYGNRLELDATGDDTPLFYDAHGLIDCTWAERIEPGSVERFRCFASVAEPAKRLFVELDSLGQSGESPAFEVTNGDMSSVSVNLGGVSSVTAGDTLNVQLAVFDAYGNPYLVQSTTEVTLDDRAGEVVGETVALDASGQGTAAIVLTSAYLANVLEVSDSGTVVGLSSAFDVIAASVDAFEVIPERTWAQLDEAMDVTVVAVDAYDNPVGGYAGTVDLASSEAWASPTSVSGFSGGEASGSVTWHTAGLGDVLVATDGTFTGQSVSIDAADVECASGPTASLSLDGDTDLTLCRVSGVTPAATLSLAGSTAGNASLSTYHYELGDGSWVRAAGATASVSWQSEGGFLVQAAVLDAAGCGDTTWARAWVADNDGEPAGPVMVTLDDDSLIAGSTSDGEAVVTLGATTCTGDPADAGEVWVRADLGDLGSGSSTLSTTGAGLSVVLDSNGEAELLWSMVAEQHAGTASVHAGVLTGAAHGEIEATVTGDAAPPTVLLVEPAGTRSDTFASVDVEFSEPMRSTNLSAVTVAITEPGGSNADVLSYDLSADQQTLSVVLANSGEAGSGTWVLGLGSNVRDSSGNRLDGTYSGSSGAFSLSFGAVSDTAPDVSSCAPSVTTFRPDGDDGAGSDADSVDIALAAGAAPDWWELRVTDDQGDDVWLTRASASASSGTLTWDGRDQSGLVVDNGTYTLTASALDSYWNVGISCDVELRVDNLLRAPGQ